MAAVTLESLDQKLDDLKELFKDHIIDDKATHAVVAAHSLQIDRLEQVESNRKWHIRTIWGAMFAGIIGWFFK